ncbi:replication-associated recombination protein A [Actinoplanes sp. TFC3]|uniref:replication-associated recombination protein A n=1 Tax=Actinoplanes sp. TFC3 TaxID=1710355 RepID=UPI00082969C8|nr:replication-associated recombination protein A [Actinoplanes sp. TFC3]
MEFDGLFSLGDPGAVRTAPPAAMESGFSRPDAASPLPVRMRPLTLDELVGQQHLLAPGAPLRQLVTGTSPMSVILWGPPGTGKTTIAHLVAGATNRKFVAMSALTAGVKDVRAVIDTARRERRAGGPPTVLFIDEVHRFSKTQQDSLLAAVEDRTVTLLAATTENPYFSVISPLLSRCVLLTLKGLDEDDVRGLLRRAVTDERGLGGQVTLTAEAEDHLVRLAAGDVRKALTALEAAAGSAQAQGVTDIDLATAEKAVDVAAVRYDRDGDAHYDVTSAFIKSMRGSDPDAAVHWLARMLVAGEDPRFIARRIVIFASEDVGMADPQALLIATAAAQAVQSVGLPEAQLSLAQAVIHMATAPKSNAVTTALFAAMSDVRAGRGGAVPAHLRDAHYPGSKGLGHGRGYRYPHDDPKGVVRQQYVPDDLTGTQYYQPTDHGAERAMAERLPLLRRIVRGVGGRSSGPGGVPAATGGSGSASGEGAGALPGTASGKGGLDEVPEGASAGVPDAALGAVVEDASAQVRPELSAEVATGEVSSRTSGKAQRGAARRARLSAPGASAGPAAGASGAVVDGASGGVPEGDDSGGSAGEDQP